ncbi:MAG: hypothetical protein IJ689_07495 [Alphaproteobacteria bacterium]|nr:hypothetical protein [Alphaproteobacteria bacterium]
MSFEFLVEQEELPRKLSSEQAVDVARNIGELWAKWDNTREKQKKIADKLRPEIYLDERHSNNDPQNWKSDIHLNKIYSLVQTQQAFIWDNIYSSVDKLFDVEGKDKASAGNAAVQKANLVNIFNAIGIQRKLDRAIEYLGTVGEFCLFVGWKTSYKQIRRPLEKLADNLSPVFHGENFGVFNQEIYNGPTVEAIDPINLVFDPKVSPEDEEKWDACGKIIKEWQTYDNICANKLYKLSPETLEEIRLLINNQNEDKDAPSTEKVDEIVEQNRIEVLQYWGNYTLKDGHTLKNWNIVVIARKYLAMFEANRWIINPIVNMAIFRDIRSKRGIPEIWSIYELAKEQEKKVNLQNDAQSLNLNPPAYAPEGFFKEKQITLTPGKQIEYKPGLDDPGAIIKMQFPLISNERIIEYYDNVASGVSGIFPNMQGQDETRDATATEIRIKVQGQTTRLAKTLDAIKQNGIVPMVVKVAELDANMKFGDEIIYNASEGLTTIGDAIRQGKYIYRYTDNSGIARKMLKNQELVKILSNVWNDPQVRLNKKEIVKEALLNADFENPEQYFLPDTEVMPFENGGRI